MSPAGVLILFLVVTKHRKHLRKVRFILTHGLQGRSPQWQSSGWGASQFGEQEAESSNWSQRQVTFQSYTQWLMLPAGVLTTYQLGTRKTQEAMGGIPDSNSKKEHLTLALAPANSH